MYGCPFLSYVKRTDSRPLYDNPCLVIVLAELTWSAAFLALEYPIEVTEVVETTVVAYL